MKTIRILAVDDHKMTLVGYKYILEDTKFPDFKIEMSMANTFNLGKEMILDSAKSNTFYDILLLDIQLSSVKEGYARTGEDLGVYAREVSPDSKIVFLSSFSDNYRINSIMNTVNPEGYMVKTDINEDALREMVETVLTEPPYYTKKAMIAIRNKMSSDIYLDDNDKKLLYYLSIGTKTKDIIEFVTLSLPGIENRKRQLKEIFGVGKENDYALINAAREKGFI
ncbi:response regulator [Cellulophaga tyrosinoxydans]|uniref:DNA-binding response regulator, NarL/FixJ family, contains REC and HTH domains n=1 Tax=Cellulophaga tyrosinoxydans TaxID=504486 RepID=A0A1W1ZQ40_9FLAO|nr:response regulator transcription factor [Cellulophaga tyrosinoxydans]SMC50539.1 DNA-binding response regulator, NarL/FixJ family, contains REC and HTH domains [Cellulophaga tyrosinoxydans]